MASLGKRRAGSSDGDGARVVAEDAGEYDEPEDE